MAYDLIQLWDGTDKVLVNPDGSLNFQTVVGSSSSAPVNSSQSGITTYAAIIGTVNTSVYGANTNRKAITLTNNSGNNISVSYAGLSHPFGFGSDLLTPYAFRVYDRFVPPLLTAVASGTSSILLVTEQL